ncbi:MAG: MFS transporter [Ktedonobacterales bacterium]
MTEVIQSVSTDHDTVSGGTPGDPTQLTWRLRAILAVVLIADILDLMDSTITNIAAPSIVRDIGGGQSLIKWLGASYALAIGVLLVVGGRLGDRYGKRRLFLIGITGFTAASALCGLSVDPTMIIIGRLIQSGFGALLIPQGISILMATFSRDQLPRAISAFGPIMGIAAVIGPIVAGFIITANIAGLDWRPVFLINIGLGITGLVAAAKLLPHDKPISREHIDVIGAALLGATMLTLIFGLIQGSTNGWTTLPIVSLIAGIVLFVSFAIRQRLAKKPLIHPSLLANKGFTAGLLVGLGLFASVSGIAYVISLFFQLILHLTPSQAAIGLAPMAIGIIAAAIICRPLLESLGRKLVTIGLLLTLVGATGLWATIAAKGLTVTAWLTAPSIFVLGVGMGACFSSIYEVAVGNVEHHEAGSASGALSAVQQLAAAIGSAVVTTIYLSLQRTDEGIKGMTVSLVVVIVMTFPCLGLVRFMPKSAPPDEALA